MIWGVGWRLGVTLTCAVLFIGLMVLGGCGAAPLVLRYTLPSTNAAPGDSCAASSSPLTDLRLAQLYWRTPTNPNFRLSLSHSVVGRAGQLDSFVVAPESLVLDGLWSFYVVTTDSTNLSCPSNIHSVMINERRPMPVTDLRKSP